MKTVTTAGSVLHDRITQLFCSPCSVWHMGQHVWLTGANVLHTLSLTFNPYFPIIPCECLNCKWKWCTGKYVHQCSCFSHMYMCVCLLYIMIYRSKKQVRRAKCSPYWGWAQHCRVICFRQATERTHTWALNLCEKGPQCPRGSEWKYVRSNRVCLSAHGGQRERVSIQAVVG